MAIRIELTSEEEAQLREQAATRRTAPEDLAAEFVRVGLRPSSESPGGDWRPVVDEDGVFHRERLEAVLARCAELSAGLPYLPPEVLTREALYRDHD